MVEAQAAARVDRLDQEKDIIIYRYIVKDSIEEVLSPLSAAPLYVY
jgi:SNF2 family DNA or RNA helicase